jgi:GNAT superfamily N-acetyltransferase
VEVEIRRAEPGEEESLLVAWEWLFEPQGRRPASWEPRRATAALAQAIGSPDALVLVAEADEQVVGFCTAYYGPHTVRFGMRVWLEELAVHPHHRSKGVGAALLDAAKDWARERGAAHLKLDSFTARTDAHRFYERERPSYDSLSYTWEL